ncbi:MAG: hypothetical protein MJZ94_10255, partial [Bacteroidales bacterium]|nr:hypothetical protein [Bacteroidales bacterium]
MKRLVLLAMLMVVAFYANAYHWTPVSGPYANTATVIGLIQINGEEQSTTTLEVGAFCGNECRGCQTPQHVPQLDCYLIFMTLYGNEGDELGFRLYDSTVGQESELTCATTAIFVANNTYGSVSSPYVLNFEGTTPEYTITVTANPSNGGTVSGSGTYNHG